MLISLVWFNAWRHDKVEALWAAFALEFLRQISRPQTPFEIIPTIFGHGKLSLARFNWKEGWLDALKALALLSIGGSAIILLIGIAIFRGSVWVNHLRETLIQVDCRLTQGKDEASPQPSPQASPQPSPSSVANLCVNQPATSNQNQRWSQWIAWIFGAGVGGASIVTVVISIAQYLQKLAGNPQKDLIQYLQSPDYEKQVAFIETFHEDFGKIVKAYAGKGNKVYVFIDDMDRCELTKAAELMQGLNLLISNDPHLIFVLAMDREKVVAGIALKQKDVLPYLPSTSIVLDTESEKSGVSSKALEYGHVFLEKFIQLPFRLPDPSERDFEEFVRATSAKQQTQSKSPQRDTLERRRLMSQTVSLERMLKWLNVVPSYRTWGFLKRLTDQLIVWNDEWKSLLERLKQQKPKLDSDKPTPTSPTANDSPAIDIQYRRETIIIDVTEDSKTVHDIVLMVAPALDYNPRRIKQFINLFRLKVFIGSQTGLFDEVINLDEENSIELSITEPSVTLEQLGKFTALCLKYPLLQRDIERDEQLLTKLYQYKSPPANPQTAVNGQPSEKDHEQPSKTGDVLTEYWVKNSQVKELLHKGCEDNAPAEQRSKCSLEHVKIKRLFQIAPEVVRRADYSKLHTLLKARRWKEADQETLKVMLKVARREEKGWFNFEDIEAFPCEDLRIIDRLWVKSSNGKFGFSVQKQIWEDSGKPMEYNDDWEKFCDRVGWRKGWKWVLYHELGFDQEKSLKGELPGCLGVGWVTLWLARVWVVSLLSRNDLPTVTSNNSSPS